MLLRVLFLLVNDWFHECQRPTSLLSVFSRPYFFLLINLTNILGAPVFPSQLPPASNIFIQIFTLYPYSKVRSRKFGGLVIYFFKSPSLSVSISFIGFSTVTIKLYFFYPISLIIHDSIYHFKFNIAHPSPPPFYYTHLVSSYTNLLMRVLQILPHLIRKSGHNCMFAPLRKKYQLPLCLHRYSLSPNLFADRSILIEWKKSFTLWE